MNCIKTTSFYYYNKMNILANTKISLVHNTLLNLNNYYKGDILFNDSIANKHFPWHNDKDAIECPQIKSRMFEAAISKCILLVYKDKYNLIERYYTEGIDFLYFNSESDALILIEKILNNYNDYSHIADNAYIKTKQLYTTEEFINIVNNTVYLK